MSDNADKAGGTQALVVITTSIVAFVSGFMLGIYAIRGYLISPELTTERQANYVDPVESDESDVDEDDTILDHAPNWANGAEADHRDGLRFRAAKGKQENKKPKAVTGKPAIEDNGEECKLVLVVRTDLGMTKGSLLSFAPLSTLAILVN